MIENTEYNSILNWNIKKLQKIIFLLMFQVSRRHSVDLVFEANSVHLVFEANSVHLVWFNNIRNEDRVQPDTYLKLVQ